jgi:hypothetical protein
MDGSTYTEGTTRVSALLNSIQNLKMFMPAASPLAIVYMYEEMKISFGEPLKISQQPAITLAREDEQIENEATPSEANKRAESRLAPELGGQRQAWLRNQRQGTQCSGGP